MSEIGISIHPPRAGRDFNQVKKSRNSIKFQSTRPVRGGTSMKKLWKVTVNISIHPPRAGRDKRGKAHQQDHHEFQSTRPVRGGTKVSRLLDRLR